MFSKLLRGKSETALFALKQQWEMEFQKANRKFQKLKVGKKKTGRPALGHLKLGALHDQEEAIDLTKIARSVATTRIGQRLHKQVVKNLAKVKENDSLSKKVRFCLIIFSYYLLSFLCFFCVFLVNLISFFTHCLFTLFN